MAVLLLAASVAAPASRLSEALELEAKGKLKESRALLRTEIDESRAASDSAGLARALSASARIAVALGDYRAAIDSATEAVSLTARLKDESVLSEDYNTLGLANVYLGNYAAALSNYQKAIEIDRQRHDGDAEIVRRNNIGNVYYYRGQYQDALRAYQLAMDTVSAAGSQPWVPKRRQLTLANLATVYQRLGNEQTALETYRQLTAGPQALPRAEYAQVLLNEGVLYRRMGDPVKALERYQGAQAIFATEHYRDGEIGALRNIGIVRALDFDDMDGAREAFTAALKLALQSSDVRGIVQATLYRAEVLRHLGRWTEAQGDLRTALEGAQKTGLVEEQWKAWYGLGKLAESQGNSSAAAELYRKAIAGIESVRGAVRRAALRGEFLADKRDVYDALIALLLREPKPPLEAIFKLMEDSRARALEERSATVQPKVLSIPAVRGSLPYGAVFVEFWAGDSDTAALWVTRSGAGVVRHNAAEAALQRSSTEFGRILQSGEPGWKSLSIDLGKEALGGIPTGEHLIVSLDGPLATVPLEALIIPGSGRLLIEDCDVSYVPAARFLQKGGNVNRTVLPPWHTQLVAFGDPPVAVTDALGGAEQWQPIAGSADEIESIARLLPGRSEIWLGEAARKHELISRRLEGVPLLLFSTHAVLDADNPDRSRILLASDYLFQREVYGLDLKGVDLATISACETARGRVVRGDGIQAFSQAFLAAGAAATVTSLWRVEDRSTAEFMKQFYYFLSRGQSKAGALRSAKLRFLKSGSRWTAPQYWAAFVLNGDGWNSCARVMPWSWFAGAAGVLVLIVGTGLRVRRRRRTHSAKAV